MKSIKSLLLMLTLLASNTPTLFAGKLHKLVKKGNVKAVSEFLQTNGNKKINTPDDDGETPLYEACYNGKLKLVKLLLEKGATASINSQNKNKKTPLYLACSKGKLKLIKLLLENGATTSINTPDNEGVTPLYWACITKSLKLVKLLLENGAKASINTSDNNKLTPLRLACSDNYLKLVKLLLNNGAKASINTPDNNGATPLMWACAYNNLKLVALLLENGAKASINTPNNTDCRPLDSACYNNNLKLVKLLLENGADATIKKTNGETPISTIYSQSWTTEQRIDLLMSLTPIEPTLPQNARIFIELVIAALAEEMSQSATVAPTVRLTDFLHQSKLITNPAAEIARIEEYIKFLLFEPRQKNKICNWPKKTDLIEGEMACPTHFKHSPAEFRLKINFDLNYPQHLFLRELLKFTQAAKELYENSKKCLSIETSENEQEEEKAAIRSSKLHDIHFWFNEELFKQFVLSKTIQEKSTVTFEDVTDQNHKK